MKNRITLVAALPVALFAAGCGGENALYEEPQPHSIPAAADTFAPETLGKDGEEPLTLPEIERFCGRFFEYEYYTAHEDEPRVFLLHPAPGVSYCANVMREEGYITLSKDAGEVTRNGDEWQWCVDSSAMDVGRLTVRSFTPRAAFWIKLQRR